MDDQFKMDSVAERLSMLLGRKVQKLDQTVGPEVDKIVSKMKPGEIVMLENTRFNAGENEADPALAKQMAATGEFVVYDAFAQSHRVHASTTGILEYHPDSCCAGFLMEKEVKVLGQILAGPMEPFVLILGGAKVSDKIAMIRNVLDRAAIVLIGGALANPFFKAHGLAVGGSIVESSFVDQAKGNSVDPVEVAKELIAKTNGLIVPHELTPGQWPDGEPVALTKVQLPVDIIVGKKRKQGGYDNSSLRIEKINGQKELCAMDEAILDIGPYTAYLYGEIVKRARTIFWNGPMGYFEEFSFSQGTKTVAEAVAASKGFSVIGGGDTEGVVTRFNLENQFGHVSSGGGASLALLAGEEFPVLKYLEA